MTCPLVARAGRLRGRVGNPGRTWGNLGGEKRQVGAGGAHLAYKPVIARQPPSVVFLLNSFKPPPQHQSAKCGKQLQEAQSLMKTVPSQNPARLSQSQSAGNHPPAHTAAPQRSQRPPRIHTTLLSPHHALPFPAFSVHRRGPKRQLAGLIFQIMVPKAKKLHGKPAFGRLACQTVAGDGEKKRPGGHKLYCPWGRNPWGKPAEVKRSPQNNLSMSTVFKCAQSP